MPHINLDGTNAYELIAYDKNGLERSDDQDGLMSKRVLEIVDREAFTDVFLMSHGWQGDLPSARVQYDAWVGQMFGSADLKQAQQRPGFRPLFIGLHWPSQPWGSEAFGAQAVSFALSETPPGLEAQVQEYAHRIADTPAALQALRTLFSAAQRQPAPASLPEEVRSAYRILDQEAGIGSSGVGSAPGEDREPFDPEQRYQDARAEASLSFGVSDLLGDLLTPLRQLSFWTMKDRARQFGESGAHALVRSLMTARSEMKLHLMGHSFGCIVMSGATAGPPGGAGLPRLLQSLVLVQGALSLWSYCSDIPYRRGRPGYFQPLMASNHVAGPIVTTRSRFDTAVGRWYPLGAGAARQIDFAPGELPRYGGVGTFGLCGPGLDLVDLDLLDADKSYDFQAGRVFNLECSRVIRDGGGASGAHSDIVHPEIAHVIWSAALA